MKLFYRHNPDASGNLRAKSLELSKAGRWSSFMVLACLACAAFTFSAHVQSVAELQGAYPIALALIIIATAYSIAPYFQSERTSPKTKPVSVVATPIESETAGGDALFRSVFRHAAGMAIVSSRGRWLTVNPALCETLGYEESELLACCFQDLTHPDDLGNVLVQLDKQLHGAVPSCQIEQRYVHKLGHNVWVLMTMSLIRDGEGEPLHFVCQFQDITRRKQAEERLVHDVFHDALTGLPNRSLFMDRLGLALERSKRRREQIFAVLFLDLDSFKAVNDTLGHLIGDQLLIEVARRLKACLRTTDTVARLGGDEFTILLEDLNVESEALRIVDRFQKELARPFKFGLSDLGITASIGIASNCAGYETAEEILRDADGAMYRAKSAGKAGYEVVDRNHHSRASLEVAHLETDLMMAIEREQLLLYYQPIVSLESGTLLGFEALVRWMHPQSGLISPTDFIPLAEESGLIIELGNWVLRKACLQLKSWREQFPFHRSLSLSVNLSLKQLMQTDLVDQIMNIVQETDLDPRLLKLELTESIVMENVGAATVMLQQLRALGVEIGIDDFGTGYSSLSYLHRLPISSLKIDASFVKGMAANDDNGEIIRTIVTLAKSLRMHVIAEGVETFEQLTKLRLLKCDAGQGFLFSKPTDAETAASFLGLRPHWQATIASIDKPHFTQMGQAHASYTVNPISSQTGLLRAV
ncbi:MAG TPA: EAL domain-containing protein [Pyrinomonadaceae bacterium]|nr:EAL domain-containing protein [Pyrinomonadaceae bacterium]